MTLHAVSKGLWTGALAASTVVAAACSSSSSSAPDAATVTTCPTSFVAASNASCALEALSCDYVAPCGAFGGSATCVCTGGTFVCSGPVVDGSAASICPDATTPPACPASEALAIIAGCTDFGRQCEYASACPSIPAFDICLCASGPTPTDGPRYHCTPSCDILDAGPTDARPADANIADVTAPTPDARSPSLDASPD